MISCILAVITGFLCLGLDQYTKLFMAQFLENRPDGVELIPGLIDLILTRNGGGAWGMLNGHTWLLLSVTIIIMLICVALLLKVGLKNKLMFWSICLILSGGLGNMIDRFFRGGKVIDFLHFSFFPQFPVFNVADICVVVGAGLMVLYFIIETIHDSRAKRASVSDETPGNHDQN